MLLRAPSTDNLIDWNYAIVSDGYFVDILGTSSRVEIHPYCNESIAPRAWEEFLLRLTAEFSKRSAEISQVLRTLEKWLLFINPYRRLDVIALDLERRLTGLDLSEPNPLPLPFGTRKQVDQHLRERRTYLDRLLEAQTAGLALRMIAPVLCEAFINFLIFLLPNDLIRSDKRVRESAVRSQVDVRAASLSMYCVGFSKQVDRNHEAFKDFCRLMDGRNDLLHGNIDPESLMFEEVYFDQRFIPLFAKDESLFNRLVKSACRHIEPSAALTDLRIARSFADYVLSCLSSEARPTVEALMRNSYPGWRPDLQRAGILFSETLRDVIPILSDDDAGPNAD